VLPLKEGTHDRAAALIEQRPPFDPEQVSLERYHVFLTDREAILVFEADSAEAVDRLGKRLGLWAAAAWKELLAGPVRLAEDVSSWVRPQPDEYVSSTPCPGPGDSDGGDLYAPEESTQAR